ncbi:MAG: type IV toxin-antitoxin system AbiEi family antitoxin domain-containing protein [Thermoplasmata archaeon]|nr:type IV toxin-antitoxin system AbiEi family antitoxin domain-containing protein [Thermoplasmata archaeon]
MKEKDLLEFAERVPVFTTKQIAAAVGDMNYSKVYLSKLASKGVIKRLKRGFYTVHEGPLIYASHIYHPSYISLWYAFQHHGTTTQLPARIEVMARKNEVIGNVELIRSGSIWGYRPINYNGFRIFIADLEKAIIDAIETERVPVDEVRNAIMKCDIARLEKYALKMPTSTIKKVGYVAEASGHFLELLHERIAGDRNYSRYYAAERGNRWRVTK